MQLVTQSLKVQMAGRVQCDYGWERWCSSMNDTDTRTEAMNVLMTVTDNQLCLSIVFVKSTTFPVFCSSFRFPFRCGEREQDLDSQPFSHSLPGQYRVVLQMF